MLIQQAARRRIGLVRIELWLLPDFYFKMKCAKFMYGKAFSLSQGQASVWRGSIVCVAGLKDVAVLLDGAGLDCMLVIRFWVSTTGANLTMAPDCVGHGGNQTNLGRKKATLLVACGFVWFQGA